MKKVIVFILCIVSAVSVFAVSASAYSIADPLVIVLDPGHGGVDSGAIYPQGSSSPIGAEREINLKIAQGIKAELSKYPQVKVLLTREDNATFKTLTERGQFAGNNNADLLISIHCNSAETNTNRGAEVWYPIDSTWCYYTHTIGAGIGTEILNQLSALGIQNRGIFTRTTTVDERYQDGSLMDYYTVINSARECGVTAIIVEHAYINNTEDFYNFLCDDQKLAKLAKADATAILKYYNIKQCNWLFKDVSDLDGWVYTSAKYVKDNGYFSGYQNGSFGVSDNMQRQDFAVVLSRFAGADLEEYKGESAFPDVAGNAYYTAAVNWAKANGILNGYENGKFGVGDAITREQLLTVFYNYAKNYLSIEVTPTATAAQNYSDYGKVSTWAQDAAVWAIDKGVITGVSGKYIAPASNAERIQVATILRNIETKGIFNSPD